MLLTGVKNWLFFNSVDILFWEIFQFCAQLCSHTACSLLIILQGALWKQSFFIWFYAIYCVWFLEILQFRLSACNFSPNLWIIFQLFNAANWCKRSDYFYANWLFFNSVDILFWEIFQFCAQLCSHTACSLLIILQGALWKQSFFYAIFNSQNNIVSMRRYPELILVSFERYLPTTGWRHVLGELNFLRNLVGNSCARNVF